MKKIVLIFAMTSSFFACTNKQAESKVDESISTVARIDDNYSTLIKKHILDDYTNNDYTKFDEIVSDSAKVYFNTTVPISKTQWRELAQLHHVYFDSINWDKNDLYVKTDSIIKDEKHENNIVKAGSIYTSVWFTWNGFGKTTHSKVANPGHILFKWENNKITVARFSFDPTVLVSEISAAQSMKK
jgi:hypothetical protein